MFQRPPWQRRPAESGQGISENFVRAKLRRRGVGVGKEGGGQGRGLWPTGAVLETLARSIRHQASHPRTGVLPPRGGREPVLACLKELNTLFVTTALPLLTVSDQRDDYSSVFIKRPLLRSVRDDTRNQKLSV